MDSKTTGQFSKFRAFFWPVHAHERRKIIPMLMMAFLISFSYNILRTAKDTLIVTAEGSGAETIPFIKVWVLLPTAIFMTFLFAKLSSKFSREQVFYILITLFLAFFFFFIFVLYPAREFLHPHKTADFLQALLPEGLKGLVAVFRNWTFTGYYVMAELWGNVILSVLFWGFANEITNVTEAKRFYGLLGTGLNFAGIFAGELSAYLSESLVHSVLPFGNTPWECTLILLISTVLVSGVLIMVIFSWMNKNVLSTPEANKSAQPNKKMKISLSETIRYISRSRYLLYIALIVLSYNLVINLVEVIWKGEMKLLFPEPNSYNAYMSKVTAAMSFIATFFSLFITGQSFRKFGWTFTAALTPLILLVASIAFFAFLFIKVFAFETAYTALGISPLLIVVFIGSAHNSLCRASKYTLFDSSKEMAFIPLTQESKRKGKAVIDGVGSRLGKSGGSLIHQCLLMTFASLTASAPYVACIVIVAIFTWLFAVKSLGKQFNSLSSQNETLTLTEKENQQAAIVLPSSASREEKVVD